MPRLHASPQPPSPVSLNDVRKQRQFNGRFAVLIALFVVLILVVLGRLLYLQVWDSRDLSRKAQMSRNHSLVLYSRGRVLDRNGVILAQDIFLHDMYAHPRYYWGVKPAEIAQALSPLLNIAPDVLTEKLSQPASTITLVKNLHTATAHKMMKAKITRLRLDEKTGEPVTGEYGQVLTYQIPVPGLDFVKKSVRSYPQGSLAAHILGYVNDEANLQSGIEAVAQKVLKKAPDSILNAAEVDGHGNPVTVSKVKPEDIVSIPHAQDVVLTIDSKLQFIAEQKLAEGLKRTGGKRGSVVIMNPRNGEVLAFAVIPTYSPENFLKASPEELKNWAISDVYPPGSTFKILTVACGLESGVINKDTKILDTGRMQVGGWTIQNYDYTKRGAPGMIDLTNLFLHSSNIASAKIALMMNPGEYKRLLSGFGFGKRTGIEMLGESGGLLSDSNDWGVAKRATMGYGYGVAATPLQMAAAVSVLANKGVWMPPHLIKTPQWRHPKPRQVLSPQTAGIVTGLLAESINNSKGSPARLDHIRVAGKTGTSRRPATDGHGYGNALYTSFVGYFPAENPQVLMMVVVDSPTMGEAWGSTVAVPIFRAIVDDALPYLGLGTSRPAVATAPAKPKTRL